MVGLLTWPAYGTWLPGPSRGWIDPGAAWHGAIVEPDRALTASRRRSLTWPVVALDEPDRRLILADLSRIARLRTFKPIVAVVDTDHVHLLLETDDDRDVPELVHDIKGSLSRTLSMAGGDAEVVATDDARPLPHHKWWTRHYSFVRLPDDRAREEAKTAMLDRAAATSAIRTDWTMPKG